jgi:cytochrome c oxidase subunit III
MNAVIATPALPEDIAAADVRIAALGWDDRRGTRAMLLFILTEAMLFVALFFAYFYLGAGQPHWPMDDPPKLTLALSMLVVLLVSSMAVWLGEQAGKRGNAMLARLLVLAGCVLGGVFLYLQTLEYADHLRVLKPTADAYASLFYTITSVHGLHVVLGLSMLIYTLLLPQPEHSDRTPYRALHNAGLYWHFVDALWIVIVLVLYVAPNTGGA